MIFVLMKTTHTKWNVEEREYCLSNEMRSEYVLAFEFRAKKVDVT